MIVFNLMNSKHLSQWQFKNSGNFGGIISKGALTIPEPDEGLNVPGSGEGLEMSDGADEINLISADIQLFFQLPESGRNRTGICSFQVASRQGHLVSPGVTFRI
jgi:hypothetical protein